MLSDILKKPCDNKAYLLIKRQEFQDLFQKKRSEILKIEKNSNTYNEIICNADRFLNNLYILPGTDGKPFFVGDPPKWTNKCVSDEEYIYSLNRLYELPTLARAYILTGNESYGKKCFVNVLDWIDKCERPSIFMDNEALVKTFQGLTPWRLLECGIRMSETWFEFYELMLHSDLMTPEFHEKILRSLYEHCEVISLISPLAWPNANHNHYLHEMMGLLFVSCRFKEFINSDKWKEQATREIFRTIKAQIASDGAQIEGCANYHDICLDAISNVLNFLSENNIVIANDIKTRIEKAYEHCAWNVTPSGYITSVGDSYMLPLYIPKILSGYYKREGNLGCLNKIITLVDKEKIADIPQDLINNAEVFAKEHKGGVWNSESIGQIIGRTGWKKDDSYFLFNCKTPVFNGHSQQDPLSFMLYLNGSEVIVDPSYSTYDDNEERRKFKSAKYHSTITFGNKEPFEYLSRWEFSPQRIGHIVKSYEYDGLLAADGYHENYYPCTHKRLCALIDNDTFIVCDDVFNPTRDSVEIRFHLSEDNYMINEKAVLNDKFKIITLPGNKTLESAKKSIYTDWVEPSSILTLEPESQDVNDVYLTAITLSKNDISFKVDKGSDIIRIELLINQKAIVVEWKFGEYCKIKSFN